MRGGRAAAWQLECLGVPGRDSQMKGTAQLAPSQARKEGTAAELASLDSNLR